MPHRYILVSLHVVFLSAVLMGPAPAAAVVTDGHLRPLTNMDFYWSATVDEFTGTIVTTAFGANSDSWIGFGIGEQDSGSMPGADIAIASFSPSTGALHIGDYYATGYTTPKLDCNTTSAWIPVSSDRNASATMIVFKRRTAAANEYEDRPIHTAPDMPTRLIFATGTMRQAGASETAHVEGRIPNYHGRTQRSLTMAQIFRSSADPMASIRANPNVHRQQLVASNYNVPARVTTYYDTPCVSAASFAGQAANAGKTPKLLALDFVTPNRSTDPFLHHMVLHGHTSSNCDDSLFTSVWACASSRDPFILPSGVGLLLNKFKSFSLEIHYDNPDRRGDIVDSSGIELFFTYDDVQEEAGVLELGDPFVRTPTTLAAGQTTSIDYLCPASCTNQWQSDITVFAQFPHMHQTGERMETVFVPPGGGDTRTQLTEYYSFHGQTNMPVTPFVVPRGSKIHTRCDFRPPANGGAVQFGAASQDEMCIHFVYYYPASANAGFLGRCGYLMCGGTIEQTTVQALPAAKAYGSECAARPPPSSAPSLGGASGANALFGGGGGAAFFLAAAALLFMSVV